MTLNLVRPGCYRSEMTFGLSREDVAQFLLDVGVKVDLSYRRDNLVSCTSGHLRCKVFGGGGD